MKKIFNVILVLCMVFMLTSCTQIEQAHDNLPVDEEQAQDNSQAVPENQVEDMSQYEQGGHSREDEGECEASELPFEGKIAIVTRPVGSGFRDYNFAVAIQRELGEDKIIHRVWPISDQEIEVMKATLQDIAAESDVRVLIISGASRGMIDAVDMFINDRDDVFIVYVTPFVSEEEVSAIANLAIRTNYPMFGYYYIKQAKRMGAETIINYKSETLFETRRPENIIIRDMMEETAALKGINFVEIDVPLLEDRRGVESAQRQAELENARRYVFGDVPRQISIFGANTAFFSPNNMFQFPIFFPIVNGSEGLFPASNRPSPFGEVGQVFGRVEPLATFPIRNRHNVYGVRWDIRTYQELIRVIREEAVRLGVTGRVSSWPMDPADFYNALAFEYAVRWINGEVDGEVVDLDLLAEIGREIIMEETGEPVGVSLERHPDFSNFILAMMDFIVF